METITLMKALLRDDMIFPGFHIQGFDWPQNNNDWRNQVVRQLELDILKTAGER